jgi:hypothetical protein
VPDSSIRSERPPNAKSETPTAPVPDQPLPSSDGELFSSGPGLSRPLPLEEVTNVFHTLIVDPSYATSYDPRYFVGALKTPLGLEFRRAGLFVPLMPTSAAECGGCTPSGRLTLNVSKPTAGSYRLLVELETASGSKSWRLDRSESALNIEPVNTEGSHDSQVFGSIQNDLARIGVEVCKSLTGRQCSHRERGLGPSAARTGSPP